jgi:hypothetical protein
LVSVGFFFSALRRSSAFNHLSLCSTNLAAKATVCDWVVME